MISATAAFGHSGGTDANGYHNDRKNGGYHCH
ncbi:MAG: YHYH domain-containing protein [Shinella sp.]